MDKIKSANIICFQNISFQMDSFYLKSAPDCLWFNKENIVFVKIISFSELKGQNWFSKFVWNNNQIYIEFGTDKNEGNELEGL